MILLLFDNWDFKKGSKHFHFLFLSQTLLHNRNKREIIHTEVKEAKSFSEKLGYEQNFAL